MKMNKLEIDKSLVHYLASLLSKHHFVLEKSNFKGERYAEFVGITTGVTYKWTIMFRPYGRFEIYLSVFYKEINHLYRQLSEKVNNGYNPVFNIRMLAYLHPKNNGMYRTTSAYLDSVCADELQSGVNLNVVANRIYDTYFETWVPRIISETDSLDKANQILNKWPMTLDEEGDPKLLNFSTNLVTQMLNGILVAISNRDANYDKIKEVYLNSANRLDNGKIPEIALMREAISRYESRSFNVL